MDIIVKDKIVEKFGIVLRIVKNNDVYVVENAALNKDGTYDKNDFLTFGGSVGYSTSEFHTEEKAKGFFNDVVSLESKQMLKKYPDIWVE